MDWRNIQFLEYALFGFIGGLVIVGALFFLYRNSLNKLGKFAHRLYKHLFPYRSIWISLLAVLSLTFLLVAIARPRVGLKPLKMKIASGNIIILFDVSRSMLATDVSPSRFERGRIFLKMLINKLAGNNIALVIFAEEATVVTPLTYDISAILASLDAVDKSIIQEQGSKITNAIAKAEHIVSIDQPAQIVIVSDGEFHEPKEEILSTVKQYNNWTFWTVGVGTKEGSPVPRGFNKAGYLKHNGKIVISKLDDETLKLIAEAGNGKYFPLEKVAPVVTQLSSLIQRRINPEHKEQVVYLQYNEWYPYLAMISFAILILIAIFPRRRIFFIFAFVFPVVVSAQSAKILTYQARQALENGDTQQALSLYQQALQKDSLYLPAKADLGLIKYGQQDYPSARIQWKSMLPLVKDKDLKSKLYYNIGNAFLKEKQIDSAINYYIKALKLNPNDTLAQYNLSYALKMRRKQNQQQNQQNNQQNQQQQNQQQNNQNQQNNQENQDKQQNDKNEQNNNSGKDKQDEDKQKQNEDQQNKNQNDGNKNEQDKNKSNQPQNKQPQDQRDEQQRTGQASPQPQQLEAIDIQDREKMRAIIRGRLSKGRRTKSEKPW